MALEKWGAIADNQGKILEMGKELSSTDTKIRKAINISILVALGILIYHKYNMNKLQKQIAEIKEFQKSKN